MSRGSRKSHRSGSTTEGFPRRRPPPKQEPKETVLIVGEGRETEPNYFRGLAKEDVVRHAFHVVVKRGVGFSARAAVERAISEKSRDRYDFVYCVVDVEEPNRRGIDLDEAFALGTSNGIRIILSNPSFEVWLLAHFERTCKPFITVDQVIAALNKHWQQHWDRDYRKNDDRIHARLADRTTTAIANARAVRQHDHCNRPVKDSNSSTEVDLLVAHLLAHHA